MQKHCLPVSIFLVFLFACKTLPPEHGPALLEFERIEADSIDKIVLYYRLRVENPRSVPLRLEIRDWKLNISGVEAVQRTTAGLEAAELYIDGKPARRAHIQAAQGTVLEKQLVLRLNLAGQNVRLKPSESEGNYQMELNLALVYHYGSTAPVHGEAHALVVFPRIREPVFSIMSIAVLQAELINTRFRVSLRIDNPNQFPVTLSAFNYELYGDGLYWAGGQEKDLLLISGESSAETRLFLTMNFINMKRYLLDEIIALRNVNYRFAGDVEVGIDIPWLPNFKMKFDHSGYSEVLR
jgi:LEA14-like dessication related protein